MPQILYTKNFGELEVIQSWVEPPNHIALLSNGAYVHITGLPVKDKAVLRKTLPVEDLQASLDWFDHRLDEQAEKPLRVMIDGEDFIFEDGSPISSIGQLTQAMKPGPMLDAALMWFTRKMDAAKGTAPVNPAKPPVKAKPKGAAKKAAKKAVKTAAQAVTA